MNILILSCGTRNKLVRYFKECKKFDKVIVTDCSEQAPAIYEADKFYIVPRMTEPGYIDCLREICTAEDINVLLPLQEDELLLIAQNQNCFRDMGIVPLVSDYDKVSLCKDKYMLNLQLREQGINAVSTFLAEEYLDTAKNQMDVFVKPRFGAGSINTMRVRTKKMLEALILESETELIVQPRIQGKEYCVDVYVDTEAGEVVAYFCKEKLRMRAGETEKSISVKNDKIKELVIKAVSYLQLRGPLDVDVMEQNGEFYVLEINPRFGGGYPHAYECGISFPNCIACNALKERNLVCADEYPEEIIAMKFSDIIIR